MTIHQRASARQSDVSRRAILKAGPAAALALPTACTAALPVAAMATPPADPVVAMAARHARLEAETAVYDDWSTAPAALRDAEMAAFNAMVRARATSLQGVSSQIDLLWRLTGPTGVDGSDLFHEQMADPTIILLGNIRSAVQTMTGEARS